mgnify:CR=1 FL=1
MLPTVRRRKGRLDSSSASVLKSSRKQFFDGWQTLSVTGYPLSRLLISTMCLRANRKRITVNNGLWKDYEKVRYKEEIVCSFGMRFCNGMFYRPINCSQGLCITCHKDISPGQVADWKSSKEDVTCSVCQGEGHQGRRPEKGKIGGLTTLIMNLQPGLLCT